MVLKGVHMIHVYIIEHPPETDEGLYAELQRFHRSGEGELDDLPWKEDFWNEEELTF
jgi:hypothetical protein